MAYRPLRNSVLLRALLLAGSAWPIAATAQDVVASPAGAEPEAATGIETTANDEGEVVVVARRYVPQGAITASKTTAPLIETPQSVSVISRDQIDLLGFTDVQQAVRYTSGIVGENYGPDLRFDFLTLRGFIPVQYIDGLQAPISSTISNVGIELYGFEAIDVLKGPAGVLYGTTPPGGIYNLTSRRPSTRLGGELQARYGTDDFKQIAGTVTGEVVDGLSARLTGLYRDRDAQTDFVNARRAYIAPAVTYAIGPDTKITALGHYQWDRVEGDTNGFLPAVGVLRPNPLGQISRSTNLGEPDYNFYRRRQWGAGYEFTHRFSSALKFTQNARWGEYHEYQQIIYPAAQFPATQALLPDNRTVTRSNFPFKDDTSQFTIDSRLDGNFATGEIEHRVLAGVDYRNYREASAFNFLTATPIDIYNPVYSATPIPSPTTLFPFTDQRLRQLGLYVQDQAKLGNFILTLTGRNDWIKLDNFAANAPFPKRKQDKLSWRVGGTYVTESGIAPYVSYATSFQPVVGQTAGGDAFVPTVGKQGEAGVKYDGRGLPSDVKLFATAAVYRINQDNVLTLDPAAGTGNVPPNAQVQTGRVRSQGVELEAVARIREQLSINASYTYTDAEIRRSNNPAQVGARLAATPRHKVSLFVDYTLSDGPLAGAGAGFGGRHLSSSPGLVRSIVGQDLFLAPKTTLFDATLHYDIPGWRFAVNGTNLFDKKYAARCEGATNCFFGQARQIIGTVTKRF